MPCYRYFNKTYRVYSSNFKYVYKKGMKIVCIYTKKS